MIPIVREFFRGLRERDELDAIIPELLTAMGMEVLSRPMVGTRQYGSDVAAVGIDDVDGVRKLFLFSIKRGDLNRREWDGDSDQALRQSLNEIRDAYLAGVAPEHRGLPVVVVITVGGIVLENTLPMVNGYMAAETRPGYELRLWTGDTLTMKVVNGALREEVFPAGPRTLLRRAAALVEEPETSVAQFSRLIREVATDDAQEPVARVRTLYLALWILTVWGREAGNLEAPYRASELVVLQSWELLWREIEDDRGRRLSASHAFNEVTALHLRIWGEIYDDKVLPHAGSRHALSFAVWSHEPIDINLALFDTVGRIAMGGLWRLWLDPTSAAASIAVEQPGPELGAIAGALAATVFSNPALFTPATEYQGVDLALALLLLAALPDTRPAAASWVQQLSRATRLGFARRAQYPLRMGDYETLIRQEALRDDDRWLDATSATMIQPLLAAFAWGLGKQDIATEIDAFQKDELAHANFQAWVVNARTEDKLWSVGGLVGSSRGSLVIGDKASELIEALRGEVAGNTAHAQLSAIRLGHWPVLLLACRVNRLPPPPQLWLPLLEDLVARPASKRRFSLRQKRRTIGRSRVRPVLLADVSPNALMLGFFRVATDAPKSAHGGSAG
ncbi:hypothetical protein VH567_11340 [Sphingomonas sp. 4RDLI-65]|uniref:hypothetical protein n=1 Tax=Sphingomonas sp. 4RDLI-65 TaxID=3111641 RepID=UPI003C179E36